MKRIIYQYLHLFYSNHFESKSLTDINSGPFWIYQKDIFFFLRARVRQSRASGQVLVELLPSGVSVGLC